MIFRYDQAVDALSIRLTDEGVSRTATIDQGTLVDLDRFGRVVAIEIIRPARPWPLEEILSRFEVDEEVSSVLRSLSEPVYPFTGASLTPA